MSLLMVCNYKLFKKIIYCLQKGRLCGPPHEKRVIYAQKCSRGGVGWVMQGWGGVCRAGMDWGWVGQDRVE